MTKKFRKRVQHVLKGGYLTKQGRIGEDMSTGSIKRNIEITDSAEAEKFVKALEQAKRICGGSHFCVEGCGTCNEKEYCNFRESEEVMEKYDKKPEKTIEDYIRDIEALQQENEQLKEQINTAKIGWDTYKTYSEQLEQQTAESNKIIETQRQEIEQLKDQNDTLAATVNMFAPYIIGKKESEVVEELKELLTLKHQNQALTADKDEQAGRIMKLDNGLTRLKLSLQWLYEINTNRWYKEWAKEKIAEIDALLGGC